VSGGGVEVHDADVRAELAVLLEAHQRRRQRADGVIDVDRGEVLRGRSCRSGLRRPDPRIAVDLGVVVDLAGRRHGEHEHGAEATLAEPLAHEVVRHGDAVRIEVEVRQRCGAVVLSLGHPADADALLDAEIVVEHEVRFEIGSAASGCVPGDGNDERERRPLDGDHRRAHPVAHSLDHLAHRRRRSGRPDHGLQGLAHDPLRLRGRNEDEKRDCDRDHGTTGLHFCLL
jgi:hypothetical protein